MVLQAGIIESDPQSELQTSYRQLMKDATELFRVVADKMYRLRTKIDLSGSVTFRSQERHQGAVSGTRTARPHRPSAVTYQARSWHLRAGDDTSSHSSNDYRVSCTRPTRARSSVRGASTFQGRNLSLVARDAALQERQSDPCDPTRRQSVHLTLSSGSVQSDTLLAENDDVANLLGIKAHLVICQVLTWRSQLIQRVARNRSDLSAEALHLQYEDAFSHSPPVL